MDTRLFNFKCRLALYLLSLVLALASSMAPKEDSFNWESYDSWAEELRFDIETVQKSFTMFLPQDKPIDPCVISTKTVET